jgi:hypothetical protein
MAARPIRFTPRYYAPWYPMLCPVCHGTHVTVVGGRRVPCPECGGLGEIHCCDGLQEQVDPPTATGQATRDGRPEPDDGPTPPGSR